MRQIIYLVIIAALATGGCLRQNYFEQPGLDGDDSDSATETASDSDSETAGAAQDSGDNPPDTTPDPCPDGCFIDDTCYANTQTAPGAACLVCDITASRTGWSPRNGASCDDGIFCNGDDTCSGGECAAHAGSPCGEMDICEEDLDECCAQNSYNACDAETNDFYAFDSCDIRRELQADCAEGHGVCTSDGCACERGWFGDDCTKCIFFVDNTVTDREGDDGRSWKAAFETVQEGIDAAAEDGCEVWVAAGDYLPTLRYPGTTERETTFLLRNGVKLYGGFAGGETAIDERDLSFSITSLNGKLHPDQEIYAYHVVTGADNTLLDGFTIRMGHALGDGNKQDVGGGLLAEGISMEIANCIIRNNLAADSGAAIHLDNADLVLRNSILTLNMVEDGGYGGTIEVKSAHLDVIKTTLKDNNTISGGAIFADMADVRVANSIFADNGAHQFGGALFLRLSNLDLINSLVHDNKADTNGGAIYGSQSTTMIFNSTLVGNWQPTGTGRSALYIDRGQIHVSNSILWKLTDTLMLYTSGTVTKTVANVTINEVVDGEDVLSGNPRFTDAGNEAYTLSCNTSVDCSPCVDAGDPALLPADELDLDNDGDTLEPIPVDLAGQPRLAGDAPDLGAYEFIH